MKLNFVDAEVQFGITGVDYIRLNYIGRTCARINNESVCVCVELRTTITTIGLRV